MRWIRTLIVLGVASLAARDAAAGPVGKLGRKAGAAAGTEYADIGGKAHVRVPPAYRYLTGEEHAAFNRDTDNVPDPDEVGILVPDSGDWYGYFFVPAEDPLGGIAKEDVSKHADELLARVRAKQASQNQARAAAGLPPLRVTGWTHQPTYDKVKDRVTWGFRLTDGEDEDDDAVNYETILFGPHGEVVDVMLVAELHAYTKPMGEYKKVVDAVVFGRRPGLSWFDLSAVAGNETGLIIGAGVMAVVVGGGLILRRSPPDRKRATLAPRSW